MGERVGLTTRRVRSRSRCRPQRRSSETPKAAEEHRLKHDGQGREPGRVRGRGPGRGERTNNNEWVDGAVEEPQNASSLRLCWAASASGSRAFVLCQMYRGILARQYCTDVLGLPRCACFGLSVCLRCGEEGSGAEQQTGMYCTQPGKGKIPYRVYLEPSIRGIGGCAIIEQGPLIFEGEMACCGGALRLARKRVQCAGNPASEK